MELSTYAAAIKAQITSDLEKAGSSLEEFESSLAALNTGEGVCKVARDSNNLLQAGLLSGGLSIKGIPDALFKTTLAGGAAAGYALDEMDSSVENMNKGLEHQLAKINLVNRLTKNLKRENPHVFPTH